MLWCFYPMLLPSFHPDWNPSGPNDRQTVVWAEVMSGKVIEKLTEVKLSSCNFKIISDLLKNGLCLGSAEADTVL